MLNTQKVQLQDDYKKCEQSSPRGSLENKIKEVEHFAEQLVQLTERVLLY